MTSEQRLALLDIYDARLAASRIIPSECPGSRAPNTYDEVLGHCRWMLGPMRRFVADEHLDKFDRWLGFVQACLWVHGIYTVDEMRAHNRHPA